MSTAAAKRKRKRRRKMGRIHGFMNVVSALPAVASKKPIKSSAKIFSPSEVVNMLPSPVGQQAPLLANRLPVGYKGRLVATKVYGQRYNRIQGEVVGYKASTEGTKVLFMTNRRKSPLEVFPEHVTTV